MNIPSRVLSRIPSRLLIHSAELSQIIPRAVFVLAAPRFTPKDAPFHTSPNAPRSCTSPSLGSIQCGASPDDPTHATLTISRPLKVDPYATVIKLTSAPAR